MVDWILLALVGSVTYFLLQQSKNRLDHVPWRLLWGVMIAPPAVVVASEQLFGVELPPLLVILLFLGSYITSVTLLRRGQLRNSTDQTPSDRGDRTEPSAAGSESPPLEPRDGAPHAPVSLESEAIAAALAHTPISEVSREQLGGCFPWTIFYLQGVEYRPQAIICRGNLRADPTEAYERINTNIHNQFGNRFLVVLQEGFAGKPFFALVPNPAARRPTTEPETRENPGLAIGLLMLTLLTTMMTGAYEAGVDPEQVWEPHLLLRGWAYALSLILILGTHELVRFIVARRHQIQTTLPYFIPFPYLLGTFGAFLQLKQPVPNRRVLFDISIAGPLAGSLMAILLLMIGLTQSGTVPAPLPSEQDSALLEFHTLRPSFSLLLGILAKIIMGAQLQPGQWLDLHPLAYGGWLGLMVIGLNLMPVGQLDGGHVVHAVYGQQMGANVGRVTRLLVLVLALLVQEWLLIWALLLFFISSADEPALNDVTDLNEGRDLLGLFALSLLVAIVIPVPPFMQVWLGLA